MAEEKRHVYQSMTLGMPPLKMVLVHARNDAQNARLRGGTAPLQPLPAAEEEAPADTARAVRKIIEHLESSER